MAVSQNEVEQFLYREARYLDDREFDKWLECYAADAEFWMPAWDDDDTLVTDPTTEISGHSEASLGSSWKYVSAWLASVNSSR